MDIFGISLLAMTTAIGGGIIRDIVLNITPPAAFLDPTFLFCSVITGLIVFTLVKHQVRFRNQSFIESALGIMDAIGLGLFTVVGVETAFTHVPEANIYLAVFIGVVNGVGGGVFRDILSGKIPDILTKHFYACASLIGAMICSFFWAPLGSTVSMLSGSFIIMILRILASYYHWNLPKIE